MKKKREILESLLDAAKHKEKGTDNCSREKLLEIATCIFNNFGTPAYLKNISVLDSDIENSTKMVILKIKIFMITFVLKDLYYRF